MSEPRVRIVQALCPERHCVMAMPYQTDDENAPGTCEDLLREKLEKLIAAGLINPVCGLCGATNDQWTYEDRPTIFRTMDEAEPHFRASEAVQRKAAEVMKAAARASRN